MSVLHCDLPRAELAYQIQFEFDRTAKYLAGVNCGVVYGGMAIARDREMLESPQPQVLIGAPGRVLTLHRDKDLKLDNGSQFVLDECGKRLERLDTRKDIQQICMEAPQKEQVMMLGATMVLEVRGFCKKLMQDPHVISVSEEPKLALHGLLRCHVKLPEKEKDHELKDLLDNQINCATRYSMLYWMLVWRRIL